MLIHPLALQLHQGSVLQSLPLAHPRSHSDSTPELLLQLQPLPVLLCTQSGLVAPSVSLPLYWPALELDLSSVRFPFGIWLPYARGSALRSATSCTVWCHRWCRNQLKWILSIYLDSRVASRFHCASRVCCSLPYRTLREGTRTSGTRSYCGTWRKGWHRMLLPCIGLWWKLVGTKESSLSPKEPFQ